ncbi:phage regulatory CII family protein [Franconibacter helveticus 513]|uniref:phage regulatory CII family protein n=1 Tax=Franconibacter helveticus TaxID=357240 RepID=UPI000412D581|nr:phage regulatory CII family protein [Franconibacter helveticus]
MFDFRVSIHPHYDEACQAFAARHNITELAKKAGINPQTLRNKLNPEQPHQLTAPEIMLLTDITEDSTLVDGFLAQMHCMPCVPVNELATEKLPVYVMKATAEVGQLAAGAISPERMTTCRKNSLVTNVNTGVRCLILAAMAVQHRIQSSPAVASAVDTVSGISATLGLM